jgi:hypothetical protein
LPEPRLKEFAFLRIPELSHGLQIDLFTIGSFLPRVRDHHNANFKTAR